MSITSHESFQQPEDLDVPIWRYMDITKLLWMLQEKALFFSRADKFDDPFEAHYPRTLAETRTSLIRHHKQLPAADRDSARLEPLLNKGFDMMLEGIKFMKNTFFVNCWHMNEHESSAMWKLYTSTQDAVCVRSSYRALASQLPSDVFLGVVKYIDYETEEIDHSNLLNYIMHKRASFSHEREARAVVWMPSQRSGDAPERTLSEFGLMIPVSLTSLVNAIYISPGSSPHILTVVRKLLDRHELHVDVRQSGLNAPPAY